MKQLILSLLAGLTLGSLFALLICKLLASSCARLWDVWRGVCASTFFGGVSRWIFNKAFWCSWCCIARAFVTNCRHGLVTACVVGAPLSMVIIILELTLSYELAVIAMVSTAVSIQVASLWFNHSFFDEQLTKRGINLSGGRTALQLSHMRVEEILTQDYVCFSSSDTVGYGLRELKNNLRSEGYCVDKGLNFVGKFRVIDLLDANKKMRLVDFCLREPITLSANDSVLDAVNIAKSFVGDSMPVLCREKKRLLGVVSEGDIFKAYIKVQNQASKVEHV